MIRKPRTDRGKVSDDKIAYKAAKKNEEQNIKGKDFGLRKARSGYVYIF